MTTFYGVSAPLASGKTTAAVEFAGCAAQVGEKFIIAPQVFYHAEFTLPMNHDEHYHAHLWVWWIGVPTIIWWPIKKLFGTPSVQPTDASVEQQIARYQRSGFKHPRQKEIERRMLAYLARQTTPSADERA